MSCFEEACIGETQAYLEASEAARHCEEARTKSVMAQIARDERTHAEFGWRMLAWIWGQLSHENKTQARGRMTEKLHGLRAKIAAQDPDKTIEHDSNLNKFGLLSPSQLQRVHIHAIQDVILPCAPAFL